jgi:hypothetical protein
MRSVRSRWECDCFLSGADDESGEGDGVTRRDLLAALGNFADGPSDPHITADQESAKNVFAEWLTPIDASGSEIGPH